LLHPFSRTTQHKFQFAVVSRLKTPRINDFLRTRLEAQHALPYAPIGWRSALFFKPFNSILGCGAPDILHVLRLYGLYSQLPRKIDISIFLGQLHSSLHTKKVFPTFCTGKIGNVSVFLSELIIFKH
jgi:hypothetical protein